MKKYLSVYSTNKSEVIWMLRLKPEESGIYLTDEQLDDLAEEILTLRGAQCILNSYEPEGTIPQKKNDK